MLFDTNGVITAYDCRESLLVTADYLFYAFLSPDNGGTEGGAKTIESKTEQFYVFLSPDNGGTEGGAKTIEAIFEMGRSKGATG